LLQFTVSLDVLGVGGCVEISVTIRDFTGRNEDSPLVLGDTTDKLQAGPYLNRSLEADRNLRRYRENVQRQHGFDHDFNQHRGYDAAMVDAAVTLEPFSSFETGGYLILIVPEFGLETNRVFVSADKAVGVLGYFFHSPVDN